MFAKLKIYILLFYVSMACHVQSAATHLFSISKRLLNFLPVDGQDFFSSVCEKTTWKTDVGLATKPRGPRPTRKFYEILRSGRIWMIWELLWPRLVFPQGIAIDDHRPMGMVYVPNWSKSQFQHISKSHGDWCNFIIINHHWLPSFCQVHWSSSCDEEVQLTISQKVVQFMLCPGDGYLWRTRTKQGWPGSYVSFLRALTGCYRLLLLQAVTGCSPLASSTMPLIYGATACGAFGTWLWASLCLVRLVRLIWLVQLTWPEILVGRHDGW